MEDKTLRFLYYMAWAAGFFAAGILTYSIIDSLIGASASIFIQIISITIKQRIQRFKRKI